ncbi:MAG: pantetheine-phosphate adenylyltransferase [Malacoplasma sp.]|nr:pantetheine-phosphate adenylyltransferase [Malacoplasma sp.]MDE6428999.1 pantetheine-phosphate adenylyltransferase [Malacoplasma sp.]
MKKCIFPGTFEIFHNGHRDVLERALKIFDFVYVLVAVNPLKKSSALKQRYKKVKDEILKLNLKNVEVKMWKGKVSDFAEINSTYFIIRGIRDVKDFQFEKSIERIYKSESDKLEVVYLISNKDLENISSRKLKKTIVNLEEK